MSNVRDCLCRKLHEGPCPQPATSGVWTAADIARGKALADGYKDVLPDAEPSGDEAKVREIVEQWMDKLPGVSSFDIEAIAKAGYAAGKADGAREERGACEKLIRARADVAYVLTDQAAPRVRKALHDIADAIARRGSEGK